MRTRQGSEVYEFAPTHVEEGMSIADPSTHLVVLKQGRWLGFRSTAAGGRLLQARKRGPSKLCLFNHNFGIFEQWETDDEPSGSGYAPDSDAKVANRMVGDELTRDRFATPADFPPRVCSPYRGYTYAAEV